MIDNMILLTTAILLFISGGCNTKNSTIESTNVYSTREFGFSQAVIYNDVIYGSGQVGWDKDFKLPQNPDFDNQFLQAIQNVEQLLQKSIM